MLLVLAKEALITKFNVLSLSHYFPNIVKNMEGAQITSEPTERVAGYF